MRVSEVAFAQIDRHVKATQFWRHLSGLFACLTRTDLDGERNIDCINISLIGRAHLEESGRVRWTIQHIAHCLPTNEASAFCDRSIDNTFTCRTKFISRIDSINRTPE